MDPTDTLGKVGENELDSIYGGSPHLRGVENAKVKNTCNPHHYLISGGYGELC